MPTILKPLKNIFFIEREDEKLSSVLVTPDNVSDHGTQWLRGRIFCCGENEFGLTKGDVVMFDKFSAVEYSLDGRKLFVVTWHFMSKSILCQLE